MADFPSTIFEPRTLENVPDHEFDAAKTKRIYAEDFNLPNAEIVAIETTLGENPQGDYASVREWLDYLAAHGGSGGSPNLDGGTPVTNYGGTTSLDGGTP
jgi:hypothetical protein